MMTAAPSLSYSGSFYFRLSSASGPSSKYPLEHEKPVDDDSSAIFIVFWLFLLPAQLSFWPFNKCLLEHEKAVDDDSSAIFIVFWLFLLSAKLSFWPLK
jgi:hypothetical protein